MIFSPPQSHLQRHAAEPRIRSAINSMAVSRPNRWPTRSSGRGGIARSLPRCACGVVRMFLLDAELIYRVVAARAVRSLSGEIAKRGSGEGRCKSFILRAFIDVELAREPRDLVFELAALHDGLKRLYRNAGALRVAENVLAPTPQRPARRHVRPFFGVQFLVDFLDPLQEWRCFRREIVVQCRHGICPLQVL